MHRRAASHDSVSDTSSSDGFYLVGRVSPVAALPPAAEDTVIVENTTPCDPCDASDSDTPSTSSSFEDMADAAASFVACASAETLDSPVIVGSLAASPPSAAVRHATVQPFRYSSRAPRRTTTGFSYARAALGVAGRCRDGDGSDSDGMGVTWGEAHTHAPAVERDAVLVEEVARGAGIEDPTPTPPMSPQCMDAAPRPLLLLKDNPQPQTEQQRPAACAGADEAAAVEPPTDAASTAPAAPPRASAATMYQILVAQGWGGWGGAPARVERPLAVDLPPLPAPSRAPFPSPPAAAAAPPALLLQQYLRASMPQLAHARAGGAVHPAWAGSAGVLSLPWPRQAVAQAVQVQCGWQARQDEPVLLIKDREAPAAPAVSDGEGNDAPSVPSSSFCDNDCAVDGDDVSGGDDSNSGREGAEEICAGCPVWTPPPELMDLATFGVDDAAMRDAPPMCVGGGGMGAASGRPCVDTATASAKSKAKVRKIRGVMLPAPMVQQTAADGAAPGRHPTPSSPPPRAARATPPADPTAAAAAAAMLPMVSAALQMNHHATLSSTAAGTNECGGYLSSFITWLRGALAPLTGVDADRTDSEGVREAAADTEEIPSVPSPKAALKPCLDNVDSAAPPMMAGPDTGHASVVIAQAETDADGVSIDFCPFTDTPFSALPFVMHPATQEEVERAYHQAQGALNMSMLVVVMVAMMVALLAPDLSSGRAREPLRRCWWPPRVTPQAAPMERAPLMVDGCVIDDEDDVSPLHSVPAEDDVMTAGILDLAALAHPTPRVLPRRLHTNTSTTRTAATRRTHRARAARVRRGQRQWRAARHTRADMLDIVIVPDTNASLSFVIPPTLAFATQLRSPTRIATARQPTDLEMWSEWQRQRWSVPCISTPSRAAAWARHPEHLDASLYFGTQEVRATTSVATHGTTPLPRHASHPLPTTLAAVERLAPAGYTSWVRGACGDGCCGGNVSAAAVACP